MEIYNLIINLKGKNPEFFDRFVESYGGRDAILAEFKPFYVDEFDRRRANGDSEGRAYKNANEALNELLLNLAKENGFWDEKITVKEKYPGVNVFNFLALNMPWNVREFIHAYGGSDKLIDHFHAVSEIEYARRRKRREKRTDAKRKARELQNWMALRAAREMGFLPYSCATGMTKITITPANASKPAASVKTEDPTKGAMHSTVADVKNTERLPSNEMQLAASVKENVQVPLQKEARSDMEKNALVPNNSKNPVQTPINAMQLVPSKEAQSAPSTSTLTPANERFLCEVQSTPSTALQLAASGKFAKGDFGNGSHGFLSTAHLHGVLLTLTVTDIGIRRFAIFRHVNVAAILAQEVANFTLRARLSVRAPNVQTLEIQVRSLAIPKAHLSSVGNAGSEMRRPMVTVTPGGNDGRLSTRNVKVNPSSIEPNALWKPITDHLQTSDQVHKASEGIPMPCAGMQHSTPSIQIPDFCFIRALTPVYMSAGQFVGPCVHNSNELSANQRLLGSSYKIFRPSPTYSWNGERNTDGHSLPNTNYFETNNPMTQDDAIFRMLTETQDYACQNCMKPTTGSDDVIENVKKPKDDAIACATKSEKPKTISSRIMGFLRSWCCGGPKKTPKETEV